MKHLKFFAALCCVAAVFAACEKNDPSDNTNNNGTNTDQNDGNSNTGSDNATGTANGHGYVDLGLPSGLKWATCNVGATKPRSTATTTLGAKLQQRVVTLMITTNGATTVLILSPNTAQVAIMAL